MKALQKAWYSCFLILLTGCMGGPAPDPVNRKEGHLIYTHHARCRMDCRRITEKEIREILERGTINQAKSDPYGKPDPKYAFEGYTDEGQHLRVIFAPESDGLVVITCIDLSTEWPCDCH